MMYILTVLGLALVAPTVSLPVVSFVGFICIKCIEDVVHIVSLLGSQSCRSIYSQASIWYLID